MTLLQELAIERAWDGVAHLCGLRDDVRAERHLDAAGRGATDGHVKEDNWVGHCA